VVGLSFWENRSVFFNIEMWSRGMWWKLSEVADQKIDKMIAWLRQFDDGSLHLKDDLVLGVVWCLKTNNTPCLSSLFLLTQIRLPLVRGRQPRQVALRSGGPSARQLPQPGWGRGGGEGCSKFK
jgi:hypothetical protein